MDIIENTTDFKNTDQLSNIYDTAQSIYSHSFQFISFGVGAEVTLVVVGFELKNSLMLFMGGVILLFLVYQLGLAGRMFSNAMISALLLEKELGIRDTYSVVRLFYIKVIKPSYNYDQLLFDIDALGGKNSIDESFDKLVKKYSPYNIQHWGGTMIFMILGILQMCFSIYLARYNGFSFF